MGGGTPKPGQGGGAVEAGPAQAADGEGPRGQAAAAEAVRPLRQAEEDNGVPATLGPTQHRLGGGEPSPSSCKGSVRCGVCDLIFLSKEAARPSKPKGPCGGFKQEDSTSCGGSAAQSWGGQCGLWGHIFPSKKPRFQCGPEDEQPPCEGQSKRGCSHECMIGFES